MSDNNNQWEVVTKSKKQKKFEMRVVALKEKKKEETLLPKLEEIMPSHQYRKLITGRGGKENSSPTKSNESSKSKSSSPKKISKSSKMPPHQRDTNKKNKNDNVKTKPKPKSLEQAFVNLTAEDFATHLEQLKIIYPGSKLAWLKEVANYLNSSLPFECDPTFAGKSVTYPSSLASLTFKQAVLDFLSSQGETNVEYFFHYTLLESMCTELNKNLPVLGYKLLLQLIAQNWPQICSNKMANTAMLRDSYQNRSNICLSILWAVGQCGYQNLVEGVKVWQNLMLPNLSMKSYCRYITEYIEKILKYATDQRLNINQNEFFATYTTLKMQYHGLPRECQQALTRSSSLFLQKYIVSTKSHANLFLNLLRENDVNGCLSILLQTTDNCFNVWKMNYKKQLMPTINLLKILESEIFAKATPLVMSPTFHKFLSDIAIINSELDDGKKRDPNKDALIELVKSVQDKATQQKKKLATEQKKKGCSCFRWSLGITLLIGLIAGALIYDTEVNGKGVFAKSASGKFLHNAGALPHVEKAWYASMSSAARGYKWAEKNLPPYTKPACQLVCDVCKLVRNVACNAFNAVNAKVPVAAEFMEQYVPGLPQKIENTAVTVKSLALEMHTKVLNFFKTTVLTGNLSPENISKTLNDTQNLALKYYNQFHKKVDAYAKLK